MEQGLFFVERSSKSKYAEAYPTLREKYDYSRAVRCPLCGASVSGGYWKRPREVVLTKKIAPDFLYTTCGNMPFVVSENALNKMKEANLSGIISAEEIETVRFQRQAYKDLPVPRYFRIELVYSRLTIDHQKSEIAYGEIRKTIQCRLCRQVPAAYNWMRSIIFHMDEYEGYDIFHIYEMCQAVILSKRFIEFYESSGLTGLIYCAAEIYGRKEADWLWGEEFSKKCFRKPDA